MKYSCIYLDPPWQYRVWARRGRGVAAKHYSVLSLDEIKALPIANICAPDCVCFMWTTYPIFPEALEVFQAWGFTYKTVAFTWVKLTKRGCIHFGLGSWTRANAEICILGTRGHPRRLNTRAAKAVRSVVASTIRKHSQKPSEVRARIVQLVGDVPRVELFARPDDKYVDGWMRTGLGLDGVNIQDFLKREK